MLYSRIIDRLVIEKLSSLTIPGIMMLSLLDPAWPKTKHTHTCFNIVDPLHPMIIHLLKDIKILL